MLTLDEINNEIAEVVAHGNTRQDVAHLASLLICRAGLRGDGIQIYSGAGKPTERIVAGDTGTEFMMCIDGKCYADVLPVMDELMTTLKALNPRLYNGVLRELLK